MILVWQDDKAVTESSTPTTGGLMPVTEKPAALDRGMFRWVPVGTQDAEAIGIVITGACIKVLRIVILRVAQI